MNNKGINPVNKFIESFVKEVLNHKHFLVILMSFGILSFLIIIVSELKTICDNLDKHIYPIAVLIFLFCAIFISLLLIGSIYTFIKSKIDIKNKTKNHWEYGAVKKYLSEMQENDKDVVIEILLDSKKSPFIDNDRCHSLISSEHRIVTINWNTFENRPSNQWEYRKGGKPYHQVSFTPFAEKVLKYERKLTDRLFFTYYYTWIDLIDNQLKNDVYCQKEPKLQKTEIKNKDMISFFKRYYLAFAIRKRNKLMDKIILKKILKISDRDKKYLDKSLNKIKKWS
jgi:hypothetical protein